MKVIYEKGKMRVPIKTWCEKPEDTALDQAMGLANHPAILHWVSLMPDTHMGMGMPIGGVVCLDDAISPNMVGADIGCGMIAWETGFTLEQFLEKKGDILKKIRYEIPTGFNHRNNPTSTSESYIEKLFVDHGEKSFWKRVNYNLECDARAQICTLGGGNHFLEIQKDTHGKIWVMIHSGSRNMGKLTGDIYHDLALACNTKWRSALNIPDLAFFPFSSEEGQEYYEAMSFCLDFALYNRYAMMDMVQLAFELAGFSITGCKKRIINIHHNYAAKESHFKQTGITHRKGATFAGPNTVGIIPGSMGTKSYIVKGRGNPQSFHSCSHGAGRAMGRAVAKRTLSMHDFEKAMKGIDFRPSEATLDESPMAYKDIDVVMKEQEDLVSILHELSPVVPIKDESEGRKGRR